MKTILFYFLVACNIIFVAFVFVARYITRHDADHDHEDDDQDEF